MASYDPKTLQEAIVYFANQQNCVDYLVARRWPNGVTCPTCGSTKVHYLDKQYRWQCNQKHVKRQFSVKVGTILEDSPITLDKWLCAMWMLANCKNGNSSWEMHRTLGVTQKTAWFMLQRIRTAMHQESPNKFMGEVEADETYIGGKARNMHRSKIRAKGITPGRGLSNGKAVVLGLLEREAGRVRCSVVDNLKKPEIQGNVRQNVEAGSDLYTDDFTPYFGLDSEFAHKVVSHAERYVDGRVHTNGLENFWSLLKRTVGGTYVSVEPFHLFRYIDEQAFRFNNRGPMNDSQRFSVLVRHITGRRLTYKELIGKEEETTPEATI